MKDGASREGVSAVQRFNLPDGKDFVLAQGYRAVIEYDE
jgi:hypothetical protein